MGEEHLFSLVEMEAGLLGKKADMEVGFLGKNGDRYMNDFPYPLTSPPPPPRSGFFEDPFYEQPRYFLHACFLCNKPLGQNMDIYMYRGDTPFCSEECRQEQIGIDEDMERNQILSLRVPPSNPSSTFQDKFCDFLQRVGPSFPGSKWKFREIPTNTTYTKGFM